MILIRPLINSFFFSNVDWYLKAGCFNAASGSLGDMKTGRPFMGSRSRFRTSLASSYDNLK